ncbi:MAG: glycosyltransferase family 2 protein, partial [Variovorax sp.]
VYHALQGFWYRFLVGAKVMELERAIAPLNDKPAMLAELSRLTGHRLATPAPQAGRAE